MGYKIYSSSRAVTENVKDENGKVIKKDNGKPLTRKLYTIYHKKVVDTESGYSFHVSGGNSKVSAVILSASSGTECANKSTCPYSMYNPNKSADMPVCYAQRGEKVFPSVKD